MFPGLELDLNTTQHKQGVKTDRTILRSILSIINQIELNKVSNSWNEIRITVHYNAKTETLLQISYNYQLQQSNFFLWTNKLQQIRKYEQIKQSRVLIGSQIRRAATNRRQDRQPMPQRGQTWLRSGEIEDMKNNSIKKRNFEKSSKLRLSYLN